MKVTGWIFVNLVVFSINQNSFSAQVHKFSKFKNFNSVYYNEANGRPALNFSFERITKKNPELAFLTLSIPFFCIENLDVKIEMKNFQGNALWNDLKEFHKKEAIRFLRANNAKVRFNFDQEKSLQITSNSLKLKKDGSYQFSGDVRVISNQSVKTFSELTLILSEGKKYYAFSENRGTHTLRIFETSHFNNSGIGFRK